MHDAFVSIFPCTRARNTNRISVEAKFDDRCPCFLFSVYSSFCIDRSRQAEVGRADGEHVSGIVGNNRGAGSEQGGEISWFLGIAGPERA